MKNIFYAAFVILLASCGSTSKSDCEKTIADYVQTDKRGTKYDLQFKVVELSELRNITVADSIAYLTGEFRKDKQLIINRIELARKMTEKLQSMEKGKHEQEKYVADIAEMNASIDSLKNLAPDNLQGYDSRSETDILGKVVRCKYSVLVPGTGVRAEDTFDFTLSPDGKRCYGKTRAK